jgi:hypothetical protein
MSPVGRAGGGGASEMATGVVVISGRWLRTDMSQSQPYPGQAGGPAAAARKQFCAKILGYAH